MEKTNISNEVLFAIAQAKADKDKMLQETPSEKFNRYLNDIIQKEISRGYSAAENYHNLMQTAQAYTYTHVFPLPIYEALSEDTISKLELSDIYLSKNKELNTAAIRIIFHFE